MSSNLPTRLSKTVANHLARVEAIPRARVAS
jgi:hypothetical protein